MNEYIDKTGAPDNEWQTRLELFNAGLRPLCRHQHHPDDATTVYCAEPAGHGGARVGDRWLDGHASLDHTEFW